MRQAFLCSLVILVVGSFSIFGQTDEDKAAIKQAALNYAEGWYEGNADKMESALHPDLAKRIVRTNDQGQSRVDQMSAMTLVQSTRTGFGKNTPKDQHQKDVTILDIFRGAASVKLEMNGWIDYMHIAKSNGKWLVVNVLWETKPPRAAAQK
jgi:hypothetical protein